MERWGEERQGERKENEKLPEMRKTKVELSHLVCWAQGKAVW